VTKYIARIVINLVTPKARAKHEPFVQQTGLWSQPLDESGKTCKGQTIIAHFKYYGR